MTRTTNGPAQTRRAAPRRRPRPAPRRRTAPDDDVPQQHRAPTTTQEPPAPRPQLRWVLVTDDSGRTHPEARWNS